MRDADAFISPEPIRDMYESDEDHVRAWLAWAKQTPGGWRARLADKRDTTVAGEVNEAGDRPESGKRTYLVRHVATPSPCCGTDVLIDPLSTSGRQGLCSTCGTVLVQKNLSWTAAESHGSD